MALSKNAEVDRFTSQELRTYSVASAKHVYKGALLEITATGYAQPLTAGGQFAGIAYEEKDNTSGAAGDIEGRVFTVGDFEFSLGGATIAHIGRPVFASADDTLSFVANGNSYVGIIADVPLSGTIVLRIDPLRRHVQTITHAVENLSAGSDIAARAIHHFGKEGWIVAARVVNQASAAAGIDDSNTMVLTLKIAAATVVAETFDSTTTFPAANAAQDLGALANNHAAAGDVLTLTVTNGAAADPGPFLVEVDYV